LAGRTNGLPGFSGKLADAGIFGRLNAPGEPGCSESFFVSQGSPPAPGGSEIDPVERIEKLRLGLEFQALGAGIS
jgi:hypothetical protein